MSGNNSLSALWEQLQSTTWNSTSYPTYGTYASSGNQMSAYDSLNTASKHYMQNATYVKVLANQQSTYDQLYKLLLNSMTWTAPLFTQPEEEFIDGEGEW